MLKIELHLMCDNRDTANLGKAVQAIEGYIDITDVQTDYSNSKTIVYGTTMCSAGEVMVRTMQDIGRPMLSKCITNYVLMDLKKQTHVPTEQEIIEQKRMYKSRAFDNTSECDGGMGCDPDMCIAHGN